MHSDFSLNKTTAINTSGEKDLLQAHCRTNTIIHSIPSSILFIGHIQKVQEVDCYCFNALDTNHKHIRKIVGYLLIMNRDRIANSSFRYDTV